MSRARYGQTEQLLPELVRQFQLAESIDIIISFVMKSGISLLEKHIRQAVALGIRIRVITSTYMNVTDPTALTILRDCIGEDGEIRLYTGASNSFHPKAYIFHGKQADCIYVGSSNVSRSALTDGVEWNYKIEYSRDQQAFDAFTERFDYLFNHETTTLTDEILKDYRDSYIKTTSINYNINQHFKKYKKLSQARQYEEGKPDTSLVAQKILSNDELLYQPNDAQLEALIELKRTRAEGNKKALVIAATGLGKTFLAAFDSEKYKKVLFIAHREEILSQAYETFAKVRGIEGLGKLYDGQFDYESNVLFASVQTLTRTEHLEKFNVNAFEYVVFDEFHHVASKSYRKILNHFEPEFMLGITATPYRMDKQNVFELCDYNVVYEVDLFTAINRDWLAPFYYYGILDATVNYDNITYLNGKYLENELEVEFNKTTRADLILEHYKKWRSKRTLGFCATIRHADYMAQYFCDKGIKAVSVHSGINQGCSMDRETAIKGLSSGDVEVIFSVDMFNEGLDVPMVDTLLFLRPTESSTVFLQQLGRGLRKANEKKRVRVLDFIGNYKKASLVPFLLGGRKLSAEKEAQLTGNSKNKISSYEHSKQLGLEGIHTYLDEVSNFPVGCVIDFEFGVIDLIDKMLRTKDTLKDRVVSEFLELKNSLEYVPSRMEFYEMMDTDFYKSVKADRKSNPFVDFLGFLDNLVVMGHIEKDEIKHFGDQEKKFIRLIETTNMSQLYKIPVLLAFCKDNEFKMSITAQDIVESFKSFYSDSQNAKDLLRNKEGKNYKNWSDRDYEKKAYDNPVKYLCKTHGDIFEMDAKTKVLRIVLDLEECRKNTDFIEQILDAIHLRRSDFMNTRLAGFDY